MSERTFTVKTTKNGLTVRHQTNAVGAENLEALGVLLSACPDEVGIHDPVLGEHSPVL